MNYQRWARGGMLIGGILFSACTSTPTPVTQPTLNAPLTAKPAARSAISEGNQLFALGQWDMAQHHYEKALHVQNTVAEAHYNLALTLDRLGHRKKARSHYMEAANLAPGHAAIWNSPVLRRYGDVVIEEKAGTSAVPALPSLGGLSGGAGAY